MTLPSWKLYGGSYAKILPPDQDAGMHVWKCPVTGRFFEVLSGYVTFNEVLIAGTNHMEVINVSE